MAEKVREIKENDAEDTDIKKQTEQTNSISISSF